ncbi:division/cell wall cluster transcriptional repressor MraZ [Candidatus Bathyarchaeota archaeon]|nr:division/cell wall cluster transcriptional repressor MraZ [Candidatus Bathyarchaeota archaeon]
MSIQELDDKGRIVIPKKERERMGIIKRVLVINAGDHLKIIPIPEKPLEALKGVLQIPESFEDLRKKAEELAIKESRRSG